MDGKDDIRKYFLQKNRWEMISNFSDIENFWKDKPINDNKDMRLLKRHLLGLLLMTTMVLPIGAQQLAFPGAQGW